MADTDNQLTHDEQMIAKWEATQRGAAPAPAQAQTPAAPETPAPTAPAATEAPKPGKELTIEPAKAEEKPAEAPKEGEEKPAEEAPKEGEENPEAEKAEKALESVGLDMNEFTSEYDADGELSEKSYEKLAKSGIGKEFVDAFIAGQEALAAQARSSVLATIGGEDQFKAMAQWAGANLSTDELEAYNNASDKTRSIAERQLAVQGLYARFTAARGSEPKLINTPNVSASAEVFRSQAEVTTAMRDPRYKSDPAYRSSVEQKVMRSKF